MPSSGVPGSPIAVSGTKFRPGDTVYFYLNANYFGGLTADSTGSFNGFLTLPAAPAGAATLYAYQEVSNAITVSKAFTVKPGVPYQSVQYISPGSSVTVNVEGLDPNVGFTTTVGKTTVPTTGPTTTDANGTINSLVIAIPAGTKAGSMTITIKDKATKAASAKFLITVYTPTLTLSASTGAPGVPVQVTGSGWRPDDTAYIYVYSTTSTYSSYICGVRADDSGNLNAGCAVPAIPAGVYSVVGQQDGTNITASDGHFTEVPGFYSLSSDVISGGGSVQLYVQGLAATSAVTVKLDGTALTLTAGTPTSDTNGSVGYLTVALPASLTAGSHTLTATDASGDVASATLTAVTPTVTLSDTSVPAGSAVVVTGSGFDGAQSIAVYLDSTYFCGLSSDQSGNLSSSCTIPAGTAAGSHTLSFQQDADGVRVNVAITTT